MSPNASYGWVHVEDVAMMHVRAYENPLASGRYLTVERVAHYSQVVKMLRKLYHNVPLPEK